MRPIRVRDAIRLSVMSILMLVCVDVEGRDIHVNNAHGSDAFNGASADAIDAVVGPVRTLKRAIQLCRRGDRIVLANTGSAYYGAMSLVGSRRSGYDGSPLIIEGQGTTISGAQQVPLHAWRNLGADIWKLNPERKAHFQLLRDGRSLPEWKTDDSGYGALPEGHWCHWKGSIFYRTFRGELMEGETYAIAREPVGLTLYGVKHVLIRNLRIQHFQIDAVNAHDLCRDVVLENVSLLENGRAGLAAGGGSRVEIRNSQVLGNRLHSMLITENADLNVVECQVSIPPTVRTGRSRQ